MESLLDPEDDFWKEVEEAESGDEIDREDHKSADEEDDEWEWLKNAGFLSSIIEDGLENREDDERGLFMDIMTTLTARQATAVRKRLDTYKETVRQKRQLGKHRSPRDVRDVFADINELPQEHPEKDATTSSDSLTVPAVSANQETISPLTPSPLASSTEIEYRRSASAEDGRPVFKETSELIRDRKKHSRSSKLEAIFRSSHKQDYDVSHRKSASNTDFMSGVEALRFQKINSVRVKGAGLSPKENLLDMPIFEEERSPLETVNWGFQLEEPEDHKDIEVFPEVTLEDCASGVTHVDDLGIDDFQTVRSLAHIQLTVIFDYDRLQYRRRKPGKAKKKESVLFGVPLSTLLENDRTLIPDIEIPIIFEKLLYHLRRKGLKEQGILRLAGSQLKTENIRNDLESCYNGNDLTGMEEILEKCFPNELAALVKQFIRELPEPLLTNEYLDAFLQVPNLTWFTNKLQALNLLVILLPQENRAVLEALLDFFADVHDESAANLMTMDNIAKVIAPTLFPPPRRKLEMDAHVQLAKISCKVIKLLISYRHMWSRVPPFLLRQARHQHVKLVKRQARDQKVLKLFNPYWKARPDNSKIMKSLLDSTKPGHVILVQSALPENPGIPVPLISNNLTAKNVLEFVYKAPPEYFQINEKTDGSPRKRSSSDAQDYPNVGRIRHCRDVARNCDEFVQNHDLYEAGGNIGERRLPLSAQIEAILHENLMAGWFIRCKHWN